MILQHKKTRKIYNFIGVEIDGVEISIKLEHWAKVAKGRYKKTRRTATVHSWDEVIEQMGQFKEIGGGKITHQDVKDWLNIAEDEE